MGIIHFMNVKEGDCIWISHPSGNNTVIDISNGNAEDSEENINIFESASGMGNYHQKDHPVNPINYLKQFNVEDILRFVLTHPDMDHMDGIKALFENFSVINFWDTENTKSMDSSSDWGNYSSDDWDFYQETRKKDSDPKVLHLYAGSTGEYYNKGKNGSGGGDGLHILAPTKELVEEANRTEDYNDCSYVILYRAGDGKRIIFAGDSAEKTWDYILENHKEDVENIDLLIAPHHGRKSGGNDDYLDVLNPKLTLFGNAKSEHLDYSSWNNRNLDHITNNQANCVIVDTSGADGMDIYVTYETFARKRNSYTYYEEKYNAWYIMTI